MAAEQGTPAQHLLEVGELGSRVTSCTAELPRAFTFLSDLGLLLSRKAFWQGTWYSAMHQGNPGGHGVALAFKAGVGEGDKPPRGQPETCHLG